MFSKKFIIFWKKCENRVDIEKRGKMRPLSLSEVPILLKFDQKFDKIQNFAKILINLLRFALPEDGLPRTSWSLGVAVLAQRLRQ